MGIQMNIKKDEKIFKKAKSLYKNILKIKKSFYTLKPFRFNFLIQIYEQID